MTEFTKKNIKKDVENSAERFGLAPDLEARFATSDLQLGQSGLGYERLVPNARVPFGHKHAQQEEVYVVVGGSGQIKIEDETVELEQWDAIRLAPDTMRVVESGPSGIEFIAFGAPAIEPERKADEVEMVQGWRRED